VKTVFQYGAWYDFGCEFGKLGLCEDDFNSNKPTSAILLPIKKELNCFSQGVKYPFFRQMDSLIVVVMDLLGYSFNQLP